MTKKHFQSLAEILGKEEASQAMINSMIEFCKKENPHFKEVTFRIAVSAARTSMRLSK